MSTEIDTDEVALCAAFMAIGATGVWDEASRTDGATFDGGFVGYMANLTELAELAVRTLDAHIGEDANCCLPLDVYQPLGAALGELLLERGTDCSVGRDEAAEIATGLLLDARGEG